MKKYNYFILFLLTILYSHISYAQDIPVKMKVTIPGNDANNAIGEATAVWRNSTLGPTTLNNWPNEQNWWTMFQTQFADSRYDAQLAFGLNRQEMWLRFHTNSTWQKWKKVIVDDGNGQVGIGTNSPLESLDISSSGMRIGSREFNLEEQAYINIYEGPSSHGVRLSLNGITDKFTLRTRLNGTDKEVLTIPYAGENSGNVGIGMSDPIAKLSVNGNILAKEVKVKTDITVPDYVFEESYNLRTIKDTKAYIQEHKHLPEIPSAAEIAENGFDLGDMDMRLLKKIEELTLHTIQQQDELDALKVENQTLKATEKKMEMLEQKITKLEEILTDLLSN